MMTLIHAIVSGFLALFSIGMVFAVTPIESAIYLILSFVSAAGILFIFHVEFLGFLLIIIYVGAIAVLFLFVIMMLKLKVKTEKDRIFDEKLSFWANIRYAFYYLLALICLLVDEIFDVIFGKFFYLFFYDDEAYLYRQQDLVLLMDNITNIELFGQVLFNYYLVPFLLAGLILLIALIGAIILTIDFNPANKAFALVNRQLSKTDNNVAYFKKAKIVKTFLLIM